MNKGLYDLFRVLEDSYDTSEEAVHVARMILHVGCKSLTDFQKLSVDNFILYTEDRTRSDFEKLLALYSERLSQLYRLLQEYVDYRLQRKYFVALINGGVHSLETFMMMNLNSLIHQKGVGPKTCRELCCIQKRFYKET